MRARYPDVEETLERDGVTIGYEVHGAGGPTILMPSSMPLVHGRQWKAQVPFLARHFRVVVVDTRGNGRSGRPRGSEAYSMKESVADLVAVLDATGTERAVAVGLSGGGRLVLELAAAHPDRVLGVVPIAPTMMFDVPGYEEVRDSYEGPEKINRHYITKEFDDFAATFLAACTSDPHSIKQREDLISWAAGTSPQVMVDAFDGFGKPTLEEARELCSRVRCPVLVLHGRDDPLIPVALGEQVAEWTGGSVVTLPGAGHAPPGRDPVRVNLLIRDFTDTVTGRVRVPRSWTPARNRPRRALFLSSPIGLGHARRDLAIADELRTLRPDVEIEWLAQHPVTELLADRGERVHPASRWLASESGHIESECGEHDLHAFQALRTMDEILVANFHVLAEIAETEHHDLWVGDEAWELDHFLHENPELKRSGYAWLTDFVGFLPMPDSPGREAELTADHNAQMLEQVERHPRLRDAALFVGDVDDVVPDTFGPGLPASATGRRTTTRSPGTSPGSPRSRNGTGPGSATSWDGRTASRSAWSPRAGPASASPCCDGCWRRSPRPHGSCRGCAPSSSPGRGSTRRRCRRRPASRCTAGSRTCTGVSPPATWRSPTAG